MELYGFKGSDEWFGWMIRNLKEYHLKVGRRRSGEK